MSKSKYVLYIGRWDVRVPAWLWKITPFAGHIQGGSK